MSTNFRLALGAALLVFGLVLPLGVYPVTQSAWPAPMKTILSVFLVFGFEIMTIPAVAIMGKENYDRIMSWMKRQARGLKPAAEVGPLRHYFGLVLFVLPIVPTYVMAYAPGWLDDTSPARLWINLAADLTFLLSLFVLGGNFWDKLRALFIREARAVFPTPVR
jgi:hypothetical protein